MSGFYSDHAEEYIASTFGTDMSSSYAMFEPLLPKGGLVLDVGFGSGRDMAYFQSKGFHVKGIDNEPSFVEHAKKMGLDAEVADMMTYEPKERFDGIWACASLLHLSRPDLEIALKRLLSFLAKDGVLFLSLKRGSGEQTDDKGRHMTYVDESLFEDFGFEQIRLAKDATRPDVIWIEGIYRNR